MSDAFRAFANRCFQDRELLAAFDRLRGTDLCRRGSPLLQAINLATGKQAQDLNAFVGFCADLWSRLPDSVKEEER